MHSHQCTRSHMHTSTLACPHAWMLCHSISEYFDIECPHPYSCTLARMHTFHTQPYFALVHLDHARQLRNRVLTNSQLRLQA
jgi:hypothetical protein